MMHDTVREELQTKITPGIAPGIEADRARLRERAAMPQRPAMIARPLVKRPETGGLAAPKTSPTLVEFQNKNASLPDWRLQLQNAVQQRKGSQNGTTAASTGTQFPASGAAVLKAEAVGRTESVATPEISDPRVANAMRRIEESRKTFREPDLIPRKAANAKPAPARFGVVSPNSNVSTAAAAARPVLQPKPRLVASAGVAERRDTNRLPLLERAAEPEIEAAPEPVIAPAIPDALPPQFAEIKRISINAEKVAAEDDGHLETATDEIEDLAPFSMRFGAGLFDMIIGGFAAMLLLSPVAFTGGNWFTPFGLLTFAGTLAIVSFVYMTLCLGFFGKTMGMRLFSLELVDAVENEYPTLHQAAINSSVFILLLAVAGAGFLTVFFNEERRALHDLLSGTILVKEF